MKLLGSSEKVISKDKNGENVPKLKILDYVILMHYNVVNNNYQLVSKFLLTFVPT